MAAVRGAPSGALGSWSPGLLTRVQSPPTRNACKPNHPNGVEEALIDVCDILESAAATAYESANQLDGSKRKLALGVVRLIELARKRVDDTLQVWPTSSHV
ncbi:hypothetical protein C3F00_021760 [Pseudomonas sp. MWU13-2860]|nr:hypothetical protein C3F00_021760 [Pseudomonas sp. MWU13-2860]